MKIKTLIMSILITGISIIISGCSVNNNSTSSNEQTNYTIQTFEKDSWTLRNGETLQFTNIITNIEDEESQLNEETETYDYDGVQLGVIRISGEDNSEYFEIIDNNTIIYNGVTYTELYSAINNIELPDNISNTTFINFIIKVLKPNGTNISVSYSNDNLEEYDDESTYLEMSFIFDGVTRYNALVSNYGKDINWSLQLYDEVNAQVFKIYGCDKYMFITDTPDLEVDMTSYSSVNENSTEQQTIDEEQEENESETENNEE